MHSAEGRTDGEGWLTVAAAIIDLQPGDFDGDGIDELAVLSRLGSGNTWFDVRGWQGPGWASAVRAQDAASSLQGTWQGVIQLIGLRVVRDDHGELRATLTELRERPELNYLFQTGTREESFMSEETFAPTALDALTEWLSERFMKKSCTRGAVCPGEDRRGGPGGEGAGGRW